MIYYSLLIINESDIYIYIYIYILLNIISILMRYYITKGITYIIYIVLLL